MNSSIIFNCCKSFLPKKILFGLIILINLSITSTTASKWPGLNFPHNFLLKELILIFLLDPDGYICFVDGK